MKNKFLLSWKPQVKANIFAWRNKFFAKCLTLALLLQLILPLDLIPQSFALTPNNPTLNNLNDGATTATNTPTFNFDLTDQDLVSKVVYQLEVDEFGGDFGTPVLTKNEQKNDFISFDGGNLHGIGLKSDGTVWAWGMNNNGQLGNGTTNQSYLPIQVHGFNDVGFLTDVVSVSAGGDSNSSIALKTDGTVWAWGDNTYGQLGNGTTTESHTPVQVSGLTGVVSVKMSGGHSLALKSDGTVWSWGNMPYGSLGDGVTTLSSVPLQVSGLTNVILISAGVTYNLALKSDGTVWAWGDNFDGQLGDGTWNDASVPVQTSITGVIEITAAFTHSLALKSDGTVWAWGDNTNGQLGDGTNDPSLTPIQVLTGFASVAARNNFSLGVKSDGTVWSWGSNSNGQLGDNTTTERLTPIQVHGENNSGFLTGVITVAQGDFFSYALKSDGSMWAWGENFVSSLGDGTTNLSHTPVRVVETITPISLDNVAQVNASGDGFSFALKNDGTLWAWGRNSSGQLGDGTTNYRRLPVQLAITNVTAVSGGGTHTIALKADGTVWAWGTMAYWTLGDGITTSSTTPIQVSGLTNITSISAGLTYNLALKNDGTVWAWGDNWDGQLGDGTWDDANVPVQTSITGVSAIVGVDNYSMALKSDGTVWAWGDNTNGQLGDGTNNASLTPIQVKWEWGVGFLTGITSIKRHTALKNDGTVWTWGDNTDGELGNGTINDSSTPIKVKGEWGVGFLTGITSIVASLNTTFAIKSDGTVWSWGSNSQGVLGVNSLTSYITTPSQVHGFGNIGFLTNINQISLSSEHVLALKPDGTIFAWGNNVDGGLGNSYIAQGTNVPDLTITSYTIDNYFLPQKHSQIAPRTVNFTPLSALLDGSYIWRVRGIDQNNESSGWTTASVGFNVTTSTAPNDPVIDNYNDGDYMNNKTPSLQFDLAHSQGTTTKYRIQVDKVNTFDSVNLIDFTELNFASVPRNNLTFTTPALTDGQWYWRVKALSSNAQESNWTTANLGFLLDSTLPVSKILYPQDGVSFKRVTKVIVSATDNNAVGSTRISLKDFMTDKYFNGTEFVSDTEVWLLTTKVNNLYEYLAPTWTNGHKYVVRSRGMDVAGNEEHTDSITFIYDTSNGYEGSIYVSNPAVMTNADFKIYYPNLASLNENGYITIDFPNEFTFSPWMEDASIVVSNASGSFTTSDSIDRLNRKITTTITSGSLPLSDLISLEINNLRVHTPNLIGNYVIEIKLFNEFGIEVDSGNAVIVIQRTIESVELNANVEQALQIGVDSGSVLLEVEPDVQFGQNWVGTGGAVTHKTAVEVKTNAVNGYNLLLKLSGNTATGSALLDGVSDNNNVINSIAGERLTTENNFSFAVDNPASVNVNAFTNASAVVWGAGLNAPTNSNINNIFYYLNIDHTTKSDIYRGTVTYTAVGQF